jgi:hypothetical protein
MELFKVLHIQKAIKKDFAVVTLKFNEEDKEYNYIRRIYKNNEYNSTVISGVEIKFDDMFNFISQEEIYEVKGIRKTDTSNITKKEKKEKVEIDETPTIEVPNKIRHEKFDMIKTCVENNIPTYLAGPAGSGKNHTLELIAKELGWNFYFSNSVQQEYKLTGFIDAGGKFHDTEFYKACTDENECMFFLDEMDASIPEVLVLLNAAIANGYFEFPNGRIDFDKVHFVAAGNTFGSGADDMYTGRMVLDQATLDRFAIIEFDYDKNVELKLAKGNTELVEFVEELRKECDTKSVRTTISYRCITMITKLEKAGMKLDDIIKITVLKGLDKDTVNTLNPTGYNKYFKALTRCKN